MDNRTIKELSASWLDNATPLYIQYPTAAPGKTDEFWLKSSLLHHIPKFHGLSMEDPIKHLKEFEVVCLSMTPVNVDNNILKMKAFPFSLLEKAKDWLYELAPGTVTSWESMKRAFLEKFFPTSRVILLRKKISGIQQGQGESFPTYYERFKALVASCPQHQLKEELLLQYFYEGLLPFERQMLDASAGGALVDKTPMAAKALIANRAHNAQQYEGVGQREGPRQQSVNEVSAICEIQSQLANLTSLVSQVVIGTKVQKNQVCTVCSIQGHISECCPQLIKNGRWESTNAIGYQNQPHEEFYFEPMQPTQSHPQSAQTSSGNTLYNDTLLKLLTNLSQGQENQTKAMQDNDKRVDHLEKQIGQIAEFVGQFRDQGRLPSSTIANPNGGFESVKAITLRSGKEVGTDPRTSKSAQKEDEKLLQEEAEQEEVTANGDPPLPQPPNAPTPPKSSNTGKVVPNSCFSNPIPPNIPFPCRLLQSMTEKGKKDIFETFHMIEVKDMAVENQVFIKKDVYATTNPREVGFDDTGQVTHFTPNLLECKAPETFNDVVFVLEFISEHTSTPSSRISILFYANLLLMIQAPTPELRSLPHHFKYHRPFKDQNHYAVGSIGN